MARAVARRAGGAGSVIAVAEHQRDVAAKQRRARTLELLEGVGLGGGHERLRCVEVAGLKAHLRCGERALRSPTRVGRQRDGALQECGRRCNPAAGARPVGGMLELPGDLLPGAGGTAGAVPGSPVGVSLGVGGLGEGTMDPMSVGGIRRDVGGRARQRMRKLDPAAELEQSGVECRAGRRHLESEAPGGTVEQHRIAERVRGRGQHEQPGVGGEPGETAGVAPFDLAGHRLAVGQPEPAGQTHRIPGARQLEQRERVAMALPEDLIADGRIQRAAQVVQKERARVALTEPPDIQVGKAREDIVGAAGPDGAHERDPLGQDAAGDEAQDLLRSPVEPLRILDDAQQRLALGQLGEQRQRGQTHHEAIRCGSGTRPNTVASASRCGTGSRSMRSSIGAQSWCSPAYGSSISDSTPAALAIRHPSRRSER